MANKNNNNELGNGQKRRLNADYNEMLPVFEEDETIEEKRAKLQDRLHEILFPGENVQNGGIENLASNKNKEQQRKEDKIAEANALKFLCKNSFADPNGFQFDGENFEFKFAVLSAEDDGAGICVGHQHSLLMEWLLGKRIIQITETEHFAAAEDDKEEMSDFKKETTAFLDSLEATRNKSIEAESELHGFLLELEKKKNAGQLGENGEWEKELAEKEEKARECGTKMNEMIEELERRKSESNKKMEELKFIDKAFRKEIFNFKSAEEYVEKGILLECEESELVEEGGKNDNEGTLAEKEKKKKFLAIRGDMHSFEALTVELFRQFNKDTIPCDYHVMFQAEVDIAKAFKEEQKLPFGLPRNWALKMQERNTATKELFQMKVSGKGISHLMQTSAHLQIDIKRSGDLAQWGDEEMRDGDYNFGKKLVEKKG